MKIDAPHGVNWYLPRKASGYKKYMPLLIKAIEHKCCLDTIKTILSRISKSTGWVLTPNFMNTVINHHRIDILNYIGEKYQKYPILNYLRECLLSCDPEIAEFIASRPRTVTYELQEQPDGNRVLSIHESKYTIKRRDIIDMVEHYDSMSDLTRSNFIRVIDILITYGHITEAVVKHLIGAVYRLGDHVNLIKVLLKGITSDTHIHRIKNNRDNTNKYLISCPNVQLMKNPW
jgi:hypothetical protein